MKVRIYVEYRSRDILTEEEFQKMVTERVNEDIGDADSDFYLSLLDHRSIKEIFEASEAEKDVMISEYREELIENLLDDSYTYRDLEI